MEISKNALIEIFKVEVVNVWVGVAVAYSNGVIVAYGDSPNEVWRKAHFKGYHNFRFCE